MSDPVRHSGWWWLPHLVSRHVERVLFALLAGMTLSLGWSHDAVAGASICLLASVVCALTYITRNRSIWRNENRFVRAPWLGFASLMLMLAGVFAFQLMEPVFPALMAVVLLVSLLALEFRNRRFLARKRVARRRRQHLRWQRQRRDLQEQLQEGLRWMAALQHDVRQPLQALGLLLSSPRINRDPQFETLVRQLQGCHQWIYELSENATEIAAIQAHQQPPPELAPADLITLLSSFSNWTAPLAKSKGLRVNIQLPSDMPMCMVTTDARKLKRVLANLLHNALRYTPKGDVTLSLQVLDSAIEIAVSDEADSLPDAIATRLLSLDLPDPVKGGLRRGLGLFVVVGFCLQMGWTLRVDRRQPRGNRITLVMPPAAVAPVQLPRQPAQGLFHPGVHAH